jgi:hypothetical protein
MKMTLLIAAVSGLYVSAALAQTAAPAPVDTTAPAAATAAPAATPSTADGAKPKPKEVLAECRSEAKTQGLKGDARKAAVQDCFVKQRPDLAGWEKCRTDPQMKGKEKDERKALMKECMKNSKG